MKFLRAALFASTIFSLASAAYAQNANPLADREDKIVPAVLLWSQQSGVKLTYLGNDGGIRGYLAEGPSGNMQAAYVTPDGTHMILGLLYGDNFDSDGSNLTGRQLVQMRDRYNRIADAVSAVSLDEKTSLQEALAKIDIPRAPYELPSFPPVDDNAPIINKLRASGYQLTPLGEEGGVRGYFASYGKIKQPLYITPDGKHFILGYLVQRGGKNVSGVQIGEMRARFDAVEGTGAAAETGSKIDGSDGPEDASTKPVEGISLPAAPAAEPPAVSSEPPVSSGDALAQPGELPVSSGIATPNAPVASGTSSSLSLPAAGGQVVGSEGNPSAPWYSEMDKAAFLGAMQTATFFDVGSQSAPTTVYMVADPNCPYCHQTWDYLKSYVQAGSVKVRIVMIAFLPGSDEKAREIMLSPRPGIRYLQSDGGRNVQIESDTSSEAWKAMAGHLLNNRNFATRFHITSTPFLAYSDADGQFYASAGVPANNNFDAFFAAARMAKK